MRPLSEAQLYDLVIVRHSSARWMYVDKVTDMTLRLIRVGRITYSRKTGQQIGGDRRIEFPTREELAAAYEEIRLAREAAEQAKRAAEQAAYDALPESVKLIRQIQGFLNSWTEKRLVELIPLDALRAFAAAIPEKC